MAYLKLFSRRIMLSAGLLIAGVLIATSGRAYAVQQDHRNDCVQVYEQQFDQYNLNTYQLDISNRKLAKLTEAATSPVGLVSPDGKNIAFLRTLNLAPNWQDNSIGLYIGPIDSAKPPVLLTTYKQLQLEHLNGDLQAYMRWSPDGKKAAFIEIENDQFYVAIGNLDGSNKRRALAPIPASYPQASEAYLSGWSADQKYIAVIVNRIEPDTDYSEQNYLSIVPVNSMTPTEIGFIRAFAPGYGRPEATWAPTGHRITYSVGNFLERSLVVWSPENKVEATTELSEGDNSYTLYWSPDGRNIRVEDSTGHWSTDVIVGLNGDKLIEAKAGTHWRFFIGWTADGDAIVADQIRVENGDNYFLLRKVDAASQQQHIVDYGLVTRYQAVISPDHQQLVYLTQTQGIYSIKLIDSTTEKARTLINDSSPTKNFIQNLALDLPWPNPTLYWSPDGNYLVHLWQDSEQQAYGYIFHPASGDFKPREINAIDFRWVENGWMVYLGHDNDAVVTKLLNLATGETTVLESVAEAPEEWTPNLTISPDKKVAALVGKGEIILTSLDPKDHWQRKIPVKNVDDMHPIYMLESYDVGTTHDISFSRYRLAWSPDSSKLAFMAPGNGNPILNVVTRDGQAVTSVPVPNDSPDTDNYYLLSWGCH